MANPATVTDIESRWRPLTDAEKVVAQQLLDDAWALLQFRLPGLQARLDAVPPTIDVELVKMVLANMVLRVLRNTEGKMQESIAGYSYTLNQAVASGWLFLSDDELGWLSPVGSSNGAYTIRPYVPASEPFYEPWWPLL